MTRQGKSVREKANWGSCGMGSVLDADNISNLVFTCVNKINAWRPGSRPFHKPFTSPILILKLLAFRSNDCDAPRSVGFLSRANPSVAIVWKTRLRPGRCTPTGSLRTSFEFLGFESVGQVASRFIPHNFSVRLPRACLVGERVWEPDRAYLEFLFSNFASCQSSWQESGIS